MHCINVIICGTTNFCICIKTIFFSGKNILVDRSGLIGAMATSGKQIDACCTAIL